MTSETILRAVGRTVAGAVALLGPRPRRGWMGEEAARERAR